MTQPTVGGPWRRRARPLLGTLVEVGLLSRHDAAPVSLGSALDSALEPAFEAAFEAVLAVQACLSRFDADSDVCRFHALACGAAMRLRPASRQVLMAAADLQDASDGLFDISLGTAADGWRLDGEVLRKTHAQVRLDLGGIAKGHAVDVAVQALIGQGCTAGWVNAGGDLRAFGAVSLPVHLRDENDGGVRPFAMLQDGAFASSHFGTGARMALFNRANGANRANRADRANRANRADRAARQRPCCQVSVAAPLCLWADALTKVVALAGDSAAALLARYGATAWQH